ncbi:MAG: Inner membrane protein YjeO [Candidatus Erwinia impunctatus]|nr:Inner membrane protein YjeO [Culicoides impunctatus]
MDKSCAGTISKIMLTIYVLFVICFCFVGSTLEKSDFIDHVEIHDVCDLLRTIVIDDYRGGVAAVTLLLMLPVLLYSIWRHFKACFVNITLLVFVMVWVWCFIINYHQCLEYYFVDPIAHG